MLRLRIQFFTTSLGSKAFLYRAMSVIEIYSSFPLLKRIPIEEIVIIPSTSTFSLICARLGWSLNEVETLSLCGRPASLLQTYIYPNAKLLILSSGKETPQTVSKILCDRQFSHSKITVLEHLGGEKERIISTMANQFLDFPEFAALNAIAVECIPNPEAKIKILSRMAGLPQRI